MKKRINDSIKFLTKLSESEDLDIMIRAGLREVRLVLNAGIRRLDEMGRLKEHNYNLLEKLKCIELVLYNAPEQ